MRETPQKGVRFAPIYATYRAGNLVHTGGVTGSIPVSPTNKSATFIAVKGSSLWSE